MSNKIHNELDNFLDSNDSVEMLIESDNEPTEKKQNTKKTQNFDKKNSINEKNNLNENTIEIDTEISIDLQENKSIIKLKNANSVQNNISSTEKILDMNTNRKKKKKKKNKKKSTSCFENGQSQPTAAYTNIIDNDPSSLTKQEKHTRHQLLARERKRKRKFLGQISEVEWKHPIFLSLPFNKVKDASGKIYVETFQYFLDMSDIQVALLCPKDMGVLFQEFYIWEKVIDPVTKIRDYGKKNIKCVRKGQCLLSLEDVNNYWNFHRRNMGELLLIPPRDQSKAFDEVTVLSGSIEPEKCGEDDKKIQNLKEKIQDKRLSIKNYIILPARIDLATNKAECDNKEYSKKIKLGNKIYSIDDSEINFMMDYWNKLYKNATGLQDHEIEVKFKEFWNLDSDKKKQDWIEKVKKEWIFQSKYAQRARYILDFFYEKPGETKAMEFFKGLYAYCKNTISFEQAMDGAKLAPSLQNSLTCEQYCYEEIHDDWMNCLKGFQELDDNYDFPQRTDRKKPYCQMQPILGVSTFDFCNKHKSRDLNFDSFRKEIAADSKKPGTFILNYEHLLIYPKTIQQFNKWMQVPSSILMWEQHCKAYEFQVQFDIPKCDSNYLFKSLCTKSVDNIFNGECLETIGDSVIKILTTFYLYFKFPTASEGQQSNMRWRLINNFYLAGIGIKSNYYFYIRQAPLQAKEWICPLLNQELKASFKPSFPLNKITNKNISDCLEAVVGAIYMSNDSLYPCMKFLNDVNMFQDYDELKSFLDNPSQYSKKMMNIIFENHKMFENVFKKVVRCEMAKTLDFNQLIKMTKGSFTKQDIDDQALYISEQPKKTLNDPSKSPKIKSLFKNGIDPCNNEWTVINGKSPQTQIEEAWQKNRNSNIKFEDFEKTLSYVFLKKVEKKIKYTFKDKRLLKTALTPDLNAFERLEFLGDAMFESYIIGPIMKTFDSMDETYTPHTLNSAKIFFLSNRTMAKLAVSIDLHKYIFTSNRKLLDNVVKFAEECLNDQQFFFFSRHDYKNLKVVSDIWEAQAGAVLLDGGWEAMSRYIGRIMKPFISFFIQNHKTLQANIFEKINYLVTTDKTIKIEKRKIEKDEMEPYECRIITPNDVYEARGDNEKQAMERAAYVWYLNGMTGMGYHKHLNPNQ